MPLPIGVVWLACSPLPPAPTDTAPPHDTAAEPSPGGFALEVHTVGVREGEPAAGACVSVLDPSPTFVGQPAAVLGEAETGASGVAVFGDVRTDSVVGLQVTVAACDGSGVPTVSTVAAEAYAGLGEGDVLREVTAWAVEAALLAELAASAAALGYAGDLGRAGFVYGWVVDAAGAPVRGATVTCAGCAPWYLDPLGDDGWFAGPGGANTATDGEGAGFVVADPPAGPYLADDGGAHPFSPAWVAGAPGVATVVTLRAE